MCFIIMIVTARTSQNFPATICIDRVSLQETCPRPIVITHHFSVFCHFSLLIITWFGFSSITYIKRLCIDDPSPFVVHCRPSTLPQVMWEGSSVSFQGYVLFPFDSVFSFCMNALHSTPCYAL